ncbi:MAG: amidohydrolase family protein [Crocosphaera sp.]|nr:amidohydrolase family protein [Crocosphaera sp.]
MLKKDIFEIPAIDHHCHNLLQPKWVDNAAYTTAFTEGNDPEILNYHAHYTLFFRRSLRDIGALLNCDPIEESIIKTRQTLGIEELSQKCFNSANLESIFLDDGFLPDFILPWQWHQQFTLVFRLIRLEYLAENLINTINDFDEFLEQFRQTIESKSSEVIGLKSIAAYRSGLTIEAIPKPTAELRFRQIRQDNTNQKIRLTDKILIDFLLGIALDIAAENKLPIQFHTGFGDRDLDLRFSNPLCLRQLLENPRWKEVPIILLHASYPYTKEAGYLASVYPQVYLDFGLAIPSLSIQGMKRVLKELLELAPTTKILYSSDAHNIPELYYLGAKWGRKLLAEVLEEAVKDGDLGEEEALEIAINILQSNAKRIYPYTENSGQK